MWTYMLKARLDSVASDHAAALNANVSPFDAAFPGTLPVRVSSAVLRFYLLG
jgi:Asp-tRNA(Asn)/Glu-tRNA(Gln) amidotransferase B subunit